MSEKPVAEFTAGPDVSRRLARTLVPDGIPPAVGQALALQLASFGPHGERTSRQLALHVGYLDDSSGNMEAVIQRLTSILDETVDELDLEPAVSETRLSAALRDQAIRLLAVDPVTDGGDTENEMCRAVITREEASSDPGVDGPAAVTPTGAVAITGGTCPKPTRVAAVDDAVPLPSSLIGQLDLVVHAGTPRRTWLDAPQTIIPDVSPLPPELAIQYLQAVRETAPEVTASARELVGLYCETVKIVSTPECDPPRVPNAAAVDETVRRVSLALARLQLATAVTPAHVSSAIRLTEQSCLDRCYRIRSLEYWRHAGEPGRAFGTPREALRHACERTIANATGPVSLTDIARTAAAVGVSTDHLAARLDRLADSLGLTRVTRAGEPHYTRIADVAPSRR